MKDGILNERLDYQAKELKLSWKELLKVFKLGGGGRGDIDCILGRLMHGSGQDKCKGSLRARERLEAKKLKLGNDCKSSVRR